MTAEEDSKISVIESVNNINAKTDSQEGKDKKLSQRFTPPELPNFKEISEDDEDYKRKLEAQCEKIKNIS